MFGWGEEKKREDGALVEADSPRVVMIDERRAVGLKGEKTPATLHLRIPMTINYPKKFDDTRDEARVIIDRLSGIEGWTQKGLEDLIAAIIFEYVDQEYKGKK